MLFTFAKAPTKPSADAVGVVRVASWLLAEKYDGCTADVVWQSDDGNTVTVRLCMAPDIESVECFEWFTQLLAEHSLTLVRDHYFDVAMRQIQREE
ncbi:MAG: hypothetical protein ACREPX_13295 [Rhodanobacteraceae bacterium]